MHEAKLCLSLIDLAREALEREGVSACRITRLRVDVGAQSGVHAHALASAFPICAAGTPAQGAELALESVPGRELRLRDMEVV